MTTKAKQLKQDKAHDKAFLANVLREALRVVNQCESELTDLVGDIQDYDAELDEVDGRDILAECLVPDQWYGYGVDLETALDGAKEAVAEVWRVLNRAKIRLVK